VSFSKSILRLVFVVLAVHAFGIPSLRIERLTAAADTIAVVEIHNVRIVTPMAGRGARALLYSADARLVRQIKGSCPSQFGITYVLGGTSGFRGLHDGVEMVFLRKTAEGFSPVDPYYPELPAVMEPPQPGLGPNNSQVTSLVIHELTNVLSSARATDNDRLRVLLLSYAIPQDLRSFKSALREGLHLVTNPDLRARMMAALILRGDADELSVAGGELLAHAVHGGPREILLYSIANGVVGHRASPSLALLASSEDVDVRRAALQAIWHGADPAGQRVAAAAISDPDQQVRFYAVRALAEITGQSDWGPSDAEFVRNERVYLDHWREWLSKEDPRSQE
jgi:hypothetical protein